MEEEEDEEEKSKSETEGDDDVQKDDIPDEAADKMEAEDGIQLTADEVMHLSAGDFDIQVIIMKWRLQCQYLSLCLHLFRLCTFLH
jgi:hypothetical protein